MAKDRFFYNLNKLNVGDGLLIEDESDIKINFVVREFMLVQSK